MSNEFLRYSLNINRRTFLSSASIGIGSLALGSLLVPDLFRGKQDEEEALPFGVTHFAPKAKRVIYLFQSGAPSQLELFDYKPLLLKMQGQELPDFCPQWTTAHGNDLQSKIISVDSFLLWFWSAWQKWSMAG